MRVYLKIKIKSLAAEARIIRQETYKFPGDHPARLGLYNHRVHDVREESRSSGLAYGFLRGRSYDRMEEWTYTAPDFKRIEELVKKFGDDDERDRMQRFSAWRDEAVAYLAAQELAEDRRARLHERARLRGPKPPYVPKVA